MTKKEGQKSPFYIAKVYPPHLSPEVKQETMLRVIRDSQILEKDNMGRESVTIGVRHNEPIQIIRISDLHVGSVAAGLQPLEDLVKYVTENKNVVVIDLGDSVEGIKAAYLDTNRTPLDLQQQIDLVRSLVYEPLAKTGRILAMVSDYWGHPGWAQDASTQNPWISMTGGTGIPLIQNGGQLVIKFANGKEVSERIWHNPPGASAVDPVSGLRDEALTTSEPKRSDSYASAHIHRSAVAEEVYAGATRKVIYTSSGTLKGSGDERDKYGIKLGKRKSDPMGQGLVVEPAGRGKVERNYPFATLEQGRTIYSAMDLLNRTESQAIKDELIEEIRSKVESAPTIYFSQNRSKLGGVHREKKPLGYLKLGGEKVVNPYSKMEMKSPYDLITYDVVTKLPIVLNFVANARIGSSLDNKTMKSLLPFIEKVNANPHSLVVFLRNMIDREAGSSEKRVSILDKYASLINRINNHTLAIMMDESLRQSSWKKKKGENGYGLPIAPASYVATETGIPLIHHLSSIDLSVGPHKSDGKKLSYLGTFVDKLNNSGSFSKPTFGLRQMYNKFTHHKPAFVAGGHMPSAGTMTFYDETNTETGNPMLVGTGWWAEYVDTMGKGNVMKGAEPGQSIILMPGRAQDDFMAFPSANLEETYYLHDALTILKGLEVLEKRSPGTLKKVLRRTK